MKRKVVLILVLVLTMGFSSMLNVYAASPEKGVGVEDQIQSRFVGILNVYANLDLNSNIATAYVRVNAKTSDSIDYVQVTAKIIDKNGSPVASFKSGKIVKDRFNRFIFEETYKLTTRGSYKMTYHIDAYKSGAIIDQMDGETDSRTY